MSVSVDQEKPMAPYLLCACRFGDRRFGYRCRNGATHIKEGYAVCSTHARQKKLKLHLTAVPYNILRPMMGDQFSRDLQATQEE